MPKRTPRNGPTEEEEAVLRAARALGLLSAAQLLRDAGRVSTSGGPSWPLRIMAAAARAFEWHREAVGTSDRRRGNDFYLYGQGAPRDVNPLFLPFVIGDVERVRAGEDPSVVSRPQLRKLLAEVVPPGRRGKSRSFLPEKVANVKASGWTDDMVMKYFGVSSPGAIRVLLSQAKRRRKC